ncbi:molybdenum cofactor guanylyltransferase [Sulfurospirillum barnesii]|uniref:Probable molybdenum cofactor guanylyltransferase n=1 Tax=Sulfurospirillum barnesii (strain ATCC 700032 / DSM 10660 / SES-3) TaxID=760154 RepID=I3Y0R8_SULBS|nr:NTP transferase domain-containing protein [Sulfurospirillum barnesii]AFL69792.1 molybdopterin-guanine dinucleotide biosynthesis protein A [Sulfurospirillum barnesii SES-3]
MTYIPLPLVIVAGGKSSRMGSDKALLPFGDFKTLTEYQIARLQPYFKSVHVSTKKRDKFDFEALFINDNATYEAHSPLIALLSILEYFNTPVCVLSVDTPFVTPEIFEKLYQTLQESTDAIIATSPTSSHPLCAIYAPSIQENIRTCLKRDEHKIRTVLNQSTTQYVPFEEDTPFLNLNRFEDYVYAKKLLG